MSSKSSQGGKPQWQWTPDKITSCIFSMRSLDIITREEARSLLRPFFGIGESREAPAVEVPGGEDEMEKARRQVG